MGQWGTSHSGGDNYIFLIVFWGLTSFSLKESSNDVQLGRSVGHKGPLLPACVVITAPNGMIWISFMIKPPARDHSPRPDPGLDWGRKGKFK